MYVRTYVCTYVCNQSTGFVQVELRESESDCSTSVLQLYWFGSFSLQAPFSFRVQCIKLVEYTLAETSPCIYQCTMPHATSLTKGLVAKGGI